MNGRRDQTSFSTMELLAELRSANPDKSWNQFLDRYSTTILHLCRQYAYDPGPLHDCYLYVCEKLSDNNFRRILQFKPEGAASFRNWLRVVISNLCLDWKRTVHGRSRPFKSIANLSKLQQQVFKYRFEQGLAFHECLGHLQAEFPGLTKPQLDGAVQRVSEELTPRQHWLISVRRAKTIPADDDIHENMNMESEDKESPEAIALRTQEWDQLKIALSRLTPEQRLLIKLRYQQDLSLKEVARLTRLGDPFRARRHIQSALDELARHLTF